MEKFTPEEAQRKYDEEWVGLNARKEAAVAVGNAALVKVCRQHLSRLSQKYADRFYRTVEAEPAPFTLYEYVALLAYDHPARIEYERLCELASEARVR